MFSLDKLLGKLGERYKALSTAMKFKDNGFEFRQLMLNLSIFNSPSDTIEKLQ